MAIRAETKVLIAGGSFAGLEAMLVRAALGGHRGDPGVADWEPLWWPPAKVAVLHLAPFLRDNIDLSEAHR